MFALRNFTWIFVALWMLSQSAGFAHHFDEHDAESSCAICIQLHNNNHVVASDDCDHHIPALENQHRLPVHVAADFFNHNLSAKARAPPATV